MPSGNERRRHPRIPVDWPAVIRMKDRTAVGEARNISARGALIQTERLLHPREKFGVFLVPPNRLAFRVSCEVAWVKARASGRKISTYVVGIHFTRLLKGDSQFLLNFIRTQLMPHPTAIRLVAGLS
jgi:PilZ domain